MNLDQLYNSTSFIMKPIANEDIATTLARAKDEVTRRCGVRPTKTARHNRCLIVFTKEAELGLVPDNIIHFHVGVVEC